jgi:hypothetical protein
MGFKAGIYAGCVQAIRRITVHPIQVFKHFLVITRGLS